MDFIIFIKKGKGAYITDVDNNKYLDYIQSWGPLIFGHANKDIEKEIIETVKNGTSFGAPTEIETTLAKEVLELFPHLDKIRFVSSGTEAVMSAIRLARGVTKRDNIIIYKILLHFCMWSSLFYPLQLQFSSCIILFSARHKHLLLNFPNHCLK